MIPSPAAVSLVKHFESFQPKAYRCPAGVWTLGYGSTLRPDGTRVQPSDTISEERAAEWLALDLAGIHLGVDGLEQHEADALFSLVYNIGAANFRRSTLLKKLISGDKLGAADEFLKWRLANGKILEGLVRRRHTERSVFRGATLAQAYRDGYIAIGKKAPPVPEEFA